MSREMIKIDSEEKILKIKVSGWISAQDILSMFRETSEELKRNSLERIFIDAREISLIPNPTAMALSRLLAKTAKEMRIAFLIRDDALVSAKTESILKEASLPHVLAFTNPDDAFYWISKEETGIVKM